MVEKIGHIKNPLTIIAIFAAIAEISGTIVLPFIAPANQAVYVWFLMIFPVLLIMFFFLTLNFNHKVLYAPSDYKNEDNFLHSLSRATFTEKFRKIEAELAEEVAALSLPATDTVTAQVEEATIDRVIDVKGSGVVPGIATADTVDLAAPTAAATGVNRPSPFAGGTGDHSHYDTATPSLGQSLKVEESYSNYGNLVPRSAIYFLMEDRVFERLSAEFSSKIYREVKVGVSGRFLFDGIVNEKGVTTIIEVTVISDSINSARRLRETIARINQETQLLPSNQRQNLRLLLAIVLPNDYVSQEQIASQIEKYRHDAGLPIEARFFRLNELEGLKLTESMRQ